MKFSTDPHWDTMICLSGPSVRLPPLPLFSFAEGARFLQNKEWLMCPDYIPDVEKKHGGVIEYDKESDEMQCRLTTTVKLECGLEGDTLLGSLRLCVGLLGSVESIHVGLVMLLVVKLHDLARDVRLEGIVGVGEVGESVLARHFVLWKMLVVRMKSCFEE
jgi:hypothetical protein